MMARSARTAMLMDYQDAMNSLAAVRLMPLLGRTLSPDSCGLAQTRAECLGAPQRSFSRRNVRRSSHQYSTRMNK